MKTANFFGLPQVDPNTARQINKAFMKNRAGIGAGLGTVAGGIGGYASAPEDSTLTDRLGRTALGAGIGAGAGAAAGQYGYGLYRRGQIYKNANKMRNTGNNLSNPDIINRRVVNQQARDRASVVNQMGSTDLPEGGVRAVTGGLDPGVMTQETLERYQKQFSRQATAIANFYSSVNY